MEGDPLLPNDWHEDPWDKVSSVSESNTEELVPDFSRFKGPIRAAVFAICGSLILLGVVGFWIARELNPSGTPGAAVTFTVNNGDTMSSVASRLQKQGIIGNATLFRWYASTKDDIQLTPGYYSLKPGDTAGNIIDTLRIPPAQTFVSVTFPEGMTIAQMGARLTSKLTRLNADVFVTTATNGSVTSPFLPSGVTTLEGLLFPDTYQVSGDDSEAKVVGTLEQTMERVAKQLDLVAGAKARGVTPYQLLIIASMVEREAKVPADRAKIAQVIYNRIAAGMKLEIDATVKYEQAPAMACLDMTATDTPHNPYIRKGLPATPIANPGRASIQAALSPAGAPPKSDPACSGLPAGVKCQYLYYVLADENGGHVFATTYEQHLVNVEKSKAAGLLP